jgi:ribosomal protein L11 methyltransferase
VAVRVAAENVATNRVARLVTVKQGSLPLEESSRAPFDLIVANISLRVLDLLKDELRSVLAPAGVALLSGLLEADAPRLLEALTANGWEPLERRDEAEWSLLVLTRAA